MASGFRTEPQCRDFNWAAQFMRFLRGWKGYWAFGPVILNKIIYKMVSINIGRTDFVTNDCVTHTYRKVCFLSAEQFIFTYTKIC